MSTTKNLSLRLPIYVVWMKGTLSAASVSQPRQLKRGRGRLTFIFAEREQAQAAIPDFKNLSPDREFAVISLTTLTSVRQFLAARARRGDSHVLVDAKRDDQNFCGIPMKSRRSPAACRCRDSRAGGGRWKR